MPVVYVGPDQDGVIIRWRDKEIELPKGKPVEVPPELEQDLEAQVEALKREHKTPPFEFVKPAKVEPAKPKTKRESDTEVEKKESDN